MCDWTGWDQGVEKGYHFQLLYSVLGCVYGRWLCYLMHLRVEEAIHILGTNVTTCPRRKTGSCLPVCPLKVEWCVLVMGVLMLLGNCFLVHMFNPTADI